MHTKLRNPGIVLEVKGHALFGEALSSSVSLERVQPPKNKTKQTNLRYIPISKLVQSLYPRGNPCTPRSGEM